jgi:hypothetical protein
MKDKIEIKPKHTPGPWYWDDEDALPWTDYDDAASAPFLMNANGCPIMTGSDIRIAYEADGRLIAAAPMLYEFARIRAEHGDAEAKSMLDLLHDGD